MGQVPQSQLDLLSRLLGELDLAQGKEQFLDTWNRTGKVYRQIWRDAEDEMLDLGVIPPEIFDMDLGLESDGWSIKEAE